MKQPGRIGLIGLSVIPVVYILSHALASLVVYININMHIVFTYIQNTIIIQRALLFIPKLRKSLDKGKYA